MTAQRKAVDDSASRVDELARIIAERIDRDVERLAAQWQNPSGTPTRHFIVDDLLPETWARDVSAAFPQEAPIWVQQKSFRERKKTFAKLGVIDPLIADITDAFHTDLVLEAVKRVTRLPALEADPELYAGGISMMGKGDFLNPHIDNSHDSVRARYRRLNLLYYISRDWRDEYGGNFELWDPAVQRPTMITSKYNRLVVMETNKYSWHSVNPVVVDKNRCCISNYYFSKSCPESSDYYHVTSFVGRPNERLLRAWGRVDNFARQWIAVNLKISRGKSQTRYSK
jgi:hypothetical protein